MSEKKTFLAQIELAIEISLKRDWNCEQMHFSSKNSEWRCKAGTFTLEFITHVLRIDSCAWTMCACCALSTNWSSVQFKELFAIFSVRICFSVQEPAFSIQSKQDDSNSNSNTIHYTAAWKTMIFHRIWSTSFSMNYLGFQATSESVYCCVSTWHDVRLANTTHIQQCCETQAKRKIKRGKKVKFCCFLFFFYDLCYLCVFLVRVAHFGVIFIFLFSISFNFPDNFYSLCFVTAIKSLINERKIDIFFESIFFLKFGRLLQPEKNKHKKYH